MSLHCRLNPTVSSVWVTHANHHGQNRKVIRRGVPPCSTYDGKRLASNRRSPDEIIQMRRMA